MRGLMFRNLLLIFILVFASCGGGTRGTGDLEMRGSAVNQDGSPLANVEVFFIGTGDSAVTMDDGSFSIITARFQGDVEFLVVSNEFEVKTTGGSISKEVSVVKVVLKIDLSEDQPSGKQEIEIEEEDHQASSGSGSNSGPNSSNDDSGSSHSGPDNEDNSSSGSDSSSSSSDGNSEVSNDDNSHGGSSDHDESGDDNSGSGSSSNDGSDDQVSDNSGSNNDSHEDDSNSGSQDDNGSGNGDEGDDGGGNDGGDNGDSKIDKEGTIQSIQGANLTVQSLTFFTNSETDFGKRSDLSEFSIGENVRVKAERVGSEWYAYEVRLK